MDTTDPRIQHVADALMAAWYPNGHPGTDNANAAEDYASCLANAQADARVAVAALDQHDTGAVADAYDTYLAEQLGWATASGQRILLEHTDTWLQCHKATDCHGEVCSLHARTDHHLRHLPQNWRGDRYLMERVCPHGVGHPDPDDYQVLTGKDNGSHGCDGCCAAPA